jgi:hypothetical protein
MRVKQQATLLHATYATGQSALIAQQTSMVDVSQTVNAFLIDFVEAKSHMNCGAAQSWS